MEEEEQGAEGEEEEEEEQGAAGGEENKRARANGMANTNNISNGRTLAGPRGVRPGTNDHRTGGKINTATTAAAAGRGKSGRARAGTKRVARNSYAHWPISRAGW